MGGITFGLKNVFGDCVHCFFVEPVQSPCMLLGMATGLNNKISVQDIGLSGKTQADGLAVGIPSAFVGSIMKKMLSGEMTVNDEKRYHYMKELMDTEDIFLEPSACAAFQGPVFINQRDEMKQYLKETGICVVLTEDIDFDFPSQDSYWFEPSLYFETYNRFRDDSLLLGVEIGLKISVADKNRKFIYMNHFDMVIASIHAVQGNN